MADEKKYVWEVWTDLLFDRPHVTRYELAHVNPAGGVSVYRYGKVVPIRPASGKRFILSYDELVKFLANWHANNLERARRRVAMLESDAADPLRGVVVNEVRGEPLEPIKNLKLD